MPLEAVLYPSLQTPPWPPYPQPGYTEFMGWLQPTNEPVRTPDEWQFLYPFFIDPGDNWVAPSLPTWFIQASEPVREVPDHRWALEPPTLIQYPPGLFTIPGPLPYTLEFDDAGRNLGLDDAGRRLQFDG